MGTRRLSAENKPLQRPRTPVATLCDTSRASHHEQILQLQSAVGNGAVAALLRQVPVVQRDEPQKPTSGGAKTQEIVFILRKPNDVYTADMTKYVKTTLKGQIFKEVANIEEMAAYASSLSAQGVKLTKVRIIGHGQTVIGGVGMTPAKEKKWRFMAPDEVKKYIATNDGKALRDAMAPGAEVEFWGCYVGGIQSAGDAWAGLFNAKIRSTKGEMRIATDTFVTQRGKAARSDKVPANMQAKFEVWLLKHYAGMRSSGEAPNLKTKDQQLSFMRDLFDRSRGVIRTRFINEKGSRVQHRPNDTDEASLWETSTP